MHELARRLPASARPKPARLSLGLLFGVLAGHAAVFWAGYAVLATPTVSEPPSVLRVSWLASDAAPEAVPPKPAPARKAVAKPRPAPSKPKVEPDPPRPLVPSPQAVQPPPPPSPTEAATKPAQPAPPPAAPAKPQVAPSPPTEPAAPPVVVPPSYHADYLDNPAPAYPAISRRAGETGTVRLRVHVAADGRPLEVTLAGSSGYRRLDHAALDAVANWRFEPARVGDRPVDGWVLVPLAFVLRR